MVLFIKFTWTLAPVFTHSLGIVPGPTTQPISLNLLSTRHLHPGCKASWKNGNLEILVLSGMRVSRKEYSSAHPFPDSVPLGFLAMATFAVFAKA